MARKFTRGRKASRKAYRKASRKASRKVRGGGSGVSAASASAASTPTVTSGNAYSFRVATPITSTSTAVGFPAELGTFSASNQSIVFSNPTKTIVDIKIGGSPSSTGSVTQFNTASTFTVSSGTKVSMKIGSTQSLVPNGVSVRGATSLPGAAATTSTYKGLVTINGLTTGSFGTLPSFLVFTVNTTD